MRTRFPAPRRPRSTARMLATTLALAVAGPLLLAGPAQARRVDQEWSVPASAWITVLGHGYGHGHGMSQYGAEGAARRGLSAREILAFYYPGTAVGRAGGTIAVLVSADTTDDLVVRTRPGLKVRALESGEVWTLPDVGASAWRVQVLPDGSTAVAYRTDRWRRWRLVAGEAEVHADGAPVTLVTPSGDTAYRGRLRSAAPVAGGTARDTVNVVTLETYLRGVVPLEMPASWSPAAVQAQAVAARTYAAYERSHPRASHYQVCDTTSCQVYGGASAEHPGSDAAVRATRGTALLSGGRPAFTQFSSSSGGWTSAGSVPYLVAREDPYDGWRGNPVHDWTLQVRDTALEAAFRRVGDLRSLRVSQREGGGEWGGRVWRLTLTGSRGSVTVNGDDLRRALGLRSSWFTFAVARR